MTERHVHWWDEAVVVQDDSSPFIPSPPRRSPTARTAQDDDDSINDSPFPQTPPTLHAQVSSSTDAYQGRHRARSILPPIQIPSAATAEHKVGLDGQSWRVGELSPRPDPYSMVALSRSLPSPSGIVPSPHKSSAQSLPIRSRRDSVVTARLHPILTFVPGRATLPIVWDIRNRPHYNTVRMTTPDDNGTLEAVSDSILNEPATSPPQRTMRIHCVGHALWEPLLLCAGDMQSSQATHPRRSGQATPSHSRRQAPVNTAEFIRVKDVILGIFNYLQRQMKQAEYDALAEKPTPGLQTAVAESFYQRCEAEERHGLTHAQQRVQSGQGAKMHSPISPLRERSGVNISACSAREGGLRRLDCLLGQTQFLGLVNVPGSAHDWFIKVEAPVRTR